MGKTNEIEYIYYLIKAFFLQKPPDPEIIIEDNNEDENIEDVKKNFCLKL